MCFIRPRLQPYLRRLGKIGRVLVAGRELFEHVLISKWHRRDDGAIPDHGARGGCPVAEQPVGLLVLVGRGIHRPVRILRPEPDLGHPGGCSARDRDLPTFLMRSLSAVCPTASPPP